MKIFQEACIVFTIYFLSEVIVRVFQLPIPASLIGMFLLFLCFSCHIIQLQQVETISNFLLKYMSFFFIPAGVNLICNFDVLLQNWFQLLIMCTVTTIITMAVTGISVQKLIERKEETE